MLQRALESFRHENYKYQNFSKYHFNVRSKPRGTKSLQVSVRRAIQLNVPGSTVFRSVLARWRCGLRALQSSWVKHFKVPYINVHTKAHKQNIQLSKVLKFIIIIIINNNYFLRFLW